MSHQPSHERRPLSVALIGSRGIPANYGGYETLMEELAVRLVERGFAVTVYCRSHSTPRTLKTYRGVRLVVLPTIRTKYLDTPVHTFLSCLHAAREPFDAILVVNSANALFLPLLKLGGAPVALHVDGIEKRRAKWGPFGRFVYAVFLTGKRGVYKFQVFIKTNEALALLGDVSGLRAAELAAIKRGYLAAVKELEAIAAPA